MSRRDISQPLQFIHFTAEDDRERVSGKPKETREEAAVRVEQMSMPGQVLHVGELEIGDVWFNFGGDGFAHGYASEHKKDGFKGDGLAHNGELL